MQRRGRNPRDEIILSLEMGIAEFCCKSIAHAAPQLVADGNFFDLEQQWVIGVSTYGCATPKMLT